MTDVDGLVRDCLGAAAIFDVIASGEKTMNPEIAAAMAAQFGQAAAALRQLQSDLTAAKAERDELRKALEPFAALGETMSPVDEWDTSVWATCPDSTEVRNVDGHGFTFGDFRRAATARRLIERET